jgi:hypothetical protein
MHKSTCSRWVSAISQTYLWVLAAICCYSPRLLFLLLFEWGHELIFRLFLYIEVAHILAAQLEGPIPRVPPYNWAYPPFSFAIFDEFTSSIPDLVIIFCIKGSFMSFHDWNSTWDRFWIVLYSRTSILGVSRSAAVYRITVGMPQTPFFCQISEVTSSILATA